MMVNAKVKMQKAKFKFEITAKDKRSGARIGIIHTPHGIFETPEYTPVATTATLKALDTQDVIDCKSNVILANTYHLFLRPGLEILEQFGGFAPFMKWEGPTITDSGGYQVSFLRTKLKDKDWAVSSETREGISGGMVKITDEGAKFRSYIDGTEHLISPEKSMEIQSVLNADIIMAFDQPVALDDSPKKKEESCNRTFKWEERSYGTWEQIQNRRKREGKGFQALYGIIQGGLDKKLRRKFMNFILETGFSGIAIGDETIGVDPKVTAQALDTITDLLPDNKPFHALGLGGGPEGVFEAVSRGVDTWDNTSVTRLARSGILFIYPEDGGTRKNKFRQDMSKSTPIKSGFSNKSQKNPISKVCRCYTCQNYSAAYIHHLLVSRELTGLRLASIHNVHFMNDLMVRIRLAIKNNEFTELKKEWLG